ncbi:hypothetical protein WSM22_36960 [Cytophagales bacterium WSM2-2]|nr:hypothetical protein WSM22_36960 [Cytophagales bacterium WSM2-2]
MKKISSIVTMIVFSAVWILTAGCAYDDTRAVNPEVSNGLIAHYKFTGNTKDSNGKTDLVATNVSYAEDRHGVANGAISFDGQTSFAATSGPMPISSSAISISTWIYSTSTITSPLVTTVLISSAVPSGSIDIWDYSYATGTVIGSARGSQWTSLTVQPVTHNVWHHVVAMTDGQNQTASLYIDNVLIMQKSLTFKTTFENFSWSLAHSASLPTWWQGRVSNLRIYNRLLSTSEIDALYKE